MVHVIALNNRLMESICPDIRFKLKTSDPGLLPEVPNKVGFVSDNASHGVPVFSERYI